MNIQTQPSAPAIDETVAGISPMCTGMNERFIQKVNSVEIPLNKMTFRTFNASKNGVINPSTPHKTSRVKLSHTLRSHQMSRRNFSRRRSSTVNVILEAGSLQPSSRACYTKEPTSKEPTSKELRHWMLLSRSQQNPRSCDKISFPPSKRVLLTYSPKVGPIHASKAQKGKRRRDEQGGS